MSVASAFKDAAACIAQDPSAIISCVGDMPDEGLYVLMGLFAVFTLAFNVLMERRRSPRGLGMPRVDELDDDEGYYQPRRIIGFSNLDDPTANIDGNAMPYGISGPDAAGKGFGFTDTDSHSQ